jgi:hypothetical protein
MKTLNVSDLAASVAVVKPTVVGAAFRIYLLGGVGLTDTERAQAAGSGYLMKENGEQIMKLVKLLDDRTAGA